MKGLLKKFAVVAALIGLCCGYGFAADDYIPHSGTTFVAEDTTREILTTLHSRLDAFRKVRLPVSETPAPETVTAVLASEAYGSLVATENTVVVPECGYDSRFLNRFWGGGLGTWQNASGRHNVAGYKYNGQGVMLGFDRAAGAAVFGAALSYVDGKYEDKGHTTHDSDIKQYSGNLYATYNNSRGFFFTLTGGYTLSDNDLAETVGGTLKTAGYISHTFNAGLRMGYDFEPSESVVITPSIGGAFFHSRTRDHNLHSGNNVERYSDMTHNMVEIPLDIAVAKEISFGENRMLQLSVNGGYAYNLNDKAIVGDISNDGGATYTRISGRHLGHNAWKGGAGARLKMDQWDIGVKYDYLGRNDFNSHRVMGTVGFSF